MVNEKHSLCFPKYILKRYNATRRGRGRAQRIEERNAAFSARLLGILVYGLFGGCFWIFYLKVFTLKHFCRIALFFRTLQYLERKVTVSLGFASLVRDQCNFCRRFFEFRFLEWKIRLASRAENYNFTSFTSSEPIFVSRESSRNRDFRVFSVRQLSEV